MDSTGVYPVISADTTWLSCCGVGHDISMFWGSEKSENCLIKSNLMADTVSSQNILCIDSMGSTQSTALSSILSDSLKGMYYSFVAWKNLQWNILVWRDGDYNSDAYYNAHIALTSMNSDGSNFTVHPAYSHNDVTLFNYRVIANDAIGAYVILAEAFPTGYGTGSLLTIYQVNGQYGLNKIKQYSLTAGNIILGASWIVDSGHFAVTLIPSGVDPTTTAGTLWLFDKNGNVVKGL
jgi:hypothetical protein